MRRLKRFFLRIRAVATALTRTSPPRDTNTALCNKSAPEEGCVHGTVCAVPERCSTLWGSPSPGRTSPGPRPRRSRLCRLWTAGWSYRGCWASGCLRRSSVSLLGQAETQKIINIGTLTVAQTRRLAPTQSIWNYLVISLLKFNTLMVSFKSEIELQRWLKRPFLISKRHKDGDFRIDSF